MSGMIRQSKDTMEWVKMKEMKMVIPNEGMKNG
jgi:hypothetical protein